MLKSKNFKCFKFYDPAYLFEKNKMSIQSDNCKETEVASNGAHTFFSLSNYFSSNSIRSFDTTTVEWLSSLEDRLKSRCKCDIIPWRPWTMESAQRWIFFSVFFRLTGSKTCQIYTTDVTNMKRLKSWAFWVGAPSPLAWLTLVRPFFFAPTVYFQASATEARKILNRGRNRVLQCRNPDPNKGNPGSRAEPVGDPQIEQGKQN